MRYQRTSRRNVWSFWRFRNIGVVRTLFIEHDIPLTMMGDSISTSVVMILDQGNIGMAVGIPLLSCVQVEIYIISNLLPVTGRHV